MTGLNLTIFHMFPDYWRDIFRNRRDACRWNCQHLYKKIVDYVCSILCIDERGL